jgi:hypothetical protein
LVRHGGGQIQPGDTQNHKGGHEVQPRGRRARSRPRLRSSRPHTQTRCGRPVQQVEGRDFEQDDANGDPEAEATPIGTGVGHPETLATSQAHEDSGDGHAVR